MTTNELLRKLKALGATVTPGHGKGGHVRIDLNGRVSFIGMHGAKKDIGPGLFAKILRDLGLKPSDL